MVSAKSYQLEQVDRDKWKATLSMGKGADGKYRRRTKTFEATGIRTARRLADDWVADTLEDVNADTFGHTLDDYLTIKASGFTEAGRRSTTTTIEIHIRPQLGDVPIADLTRRHIADWQGSQSGAATTLRNRAKLLRMVMRWAAKTGRMSRPLQVELSDALEVVKTRKRTAPASVDVVRLINTATDRWSTLLTLAAVTGMRRAELAGLQVGDVDLSARTIRVERALHIDGKLGDTKTDSSRRVIHIDAHTAALLATHLEKAMGAWHGIDGAVIAMPPTAPLFAHADGGHIPINRLTAMVAETRERAGIDGVVLHDLRRMMATELRALGVDPLVVAARLGHSGSGMTDHYTTVLDESAIKAGDLIGERVRSLLEADRLMTR